MRKQASTCVEVSSALTRVASHLRKTTSELDRIRTEYNTVRLHAGLGYVTPDDEHNERGDALRQARADGLARARTQRINYRRNTQEKQQ